MDNLEQHLLDLGFKLEKNLIIDRYTLDISFNPMFEFRQLSVTTEQGNQYIMIRQGDLERPRHEDECCTLFNSDYQGELTLEVIDDLVKVLSVNNRKKRSL